MESAPGRRVSRSIGNHILVSDRATFSTAIQNMLSKHILIAAGPVVMPLHQPDHLRNPCFWPFKDRLLQIFVARSDQKKNGGDDGTRTRDLCRDSSKSDDDSK